MKLDTLTPLNRYGITAQLASDRVIGAYSTSFGAATRLLGVRHRGPVRSIYALVRVADELVDGVGSEAGLSLDAQHRALDELEAETLHAVTSGYSSNPIVHAFAVTAREAGITEDLIVPFFASMRTDLVPRLADTGSEALRGFGPEAHAVYVHGSAEVVGLMCLRVFLRDSRHDVITRFRIERGARQLGAAFQNVNFLRDLGDDTQLLGRNYLNEAGELDEASKANWLAVIRQQLADAREVIPLLPVDARAAVLSAHDLFAELANRIEPVPVTQLAHHRVSVPGPVKLALIASAVLRSRWLR